MYILKVPRLDAPPESQDAPTLEITMDTFGEFDTVQEALDEALAHKVDETTAVIESDTGEDRRTVMEWRDAPQLVA